MRLHKRAIYAVLGLIVGCSSPPVSPLQDVAAEQVKLVQVRAANGASGELKGRKELEPFLQGLRDLEAFRTGKVNPQLDITVVMHDGPTLSFRMGRDHIGPKVPASDVVWRWQLRDEVPYRLAQSALQEGSR